MKSISLCVILWLVTASQMVAQPKFDKAEVKSWMKRVADWQIANPNKEAEHDDLDWTHAALYMGMVDWAEFASYWPKKSFPDGQVDVSCRLHCRGAAFH